MLTDKGERMSERDFYNLRELIRKLQQKVALLERKLEDKKEFVEIK